MLPEEGGVDAAGLDLVEREFFGVDVMDREERGDAVAAGGSGDEAGHPVVAVDEVGGDARDDVVDDLALEGEGDAGVFAAVVGVDRVAVVEDAVLCEVDAFFREPFADGFEFLAEDVVDIGVEHLTVVREGDVDISAEFEERGDERGGDVGEPAGLGVHSLGHIAHAFRQIGDFRGDDEDSRIGHEGGSGWELARRGLGLLRPCYVSRGGGLPFAAGREDPGGEPEATAGGAGDGDDVFVPAVRGGFAECHGVEGWGFDLISCVGGAGAEFDGDLVRGELSEEDGGDETEGIAGVESAEVAIRLRGVDADVVPCGVEADTLSVEGDGGASGVGHEVAVVFRGWDVEFVAVFCDHASGGEEAEAHADGGFHHGDPACGVAAAGACVEERGDVVFEHAVEGGGFDGVAVFVVFVFLAIADGPAAVGGVALAPPAVEDGDIETAVDGGFHA